MVYFTDKERRSEYKKSTKNRHRHVTYIGQRAVARVVPGERLHALSVGTLPLPVQRRLRHAAGARVCCAASRGNRPASSVRVPTAAGASPVATPTCFEAAK